MGAALRRAGTQRPPLHPPGCQDSGLSTWDMVAQLCHSTASLGIGGGSPSVLALRGLGGLLAPAQGACMSLGLCGVALAFLMFPRGEGTQLLSIFPRSVPCLSCAPVGAAVGSFGRRWWCPPCPAPPWLQHPRPLPPACPAGLQSPGAPSPALVSVNSPLVSPPVQPPSGFWSCWEPDLS